VFYEGGNTVMTGKALMARHVRFRRWWRDRFARMRAPGDDAGMSTAEYAVGTVAACAFAVVLYKVVTSGTVSSALAGLLRRALGGGF
jgi:hypothetical protein